MRHFVTFTSCLLLAGNLGWGLLASSSIGMVIAPGVFQVNDAHVNGTATLFDGSVIQTGKAVGDLRLNRGAKAQLGSESRGRVFVDHLVLEQGSGQLVGTGYRIEARSLRIVADEPYAAARVALNGARQVQVAALRGRLHVTNARGVLVASLEPGTALNLQQEGDSRSAASRVTGVLSRKGDRYFLTDETTHVTVELRGIHLKSKVGKRIEVSGEEVANAVPMLPATQVIAVKTATVVAVAAAGAGGAAGTAAAGASVGGISATTVAVIGGVAAAGTVSGLAIAGSLPGQGDSSAPTSSR